LKKLESEGLLKAEARHGFRVVETAGSPTANRPVAYVTARALDLSDGQAVNWALASLLQEEAAERGWGMMGIHGRPEQVVEQLTESGTWGAILDTNDPELLDCLRQTGMPVVMVNSMEEHVDIDLVMQDNYLGGYRAAMHLIDGGARRLGWVGHLSQFCHGRERFAGVQACARARGVELRAEHVLDADGPPDRKKLMSMLRVKKRPDGVLAFPPAANKGVLSALDELGLRLGKDLRMVGWCAEEVYESEYVPRFGRGRPAPAMVWSVTCMAREALNRLLLQRDGGRASTLRTNVPVTLRLAE
jgi:DNA-binding LacI/PurR family transcriptional regulator